MKILALITFLFATAAFGHTLECKISYNGQVALTHYLPAEEGDLQQMIYVVGQETWQAPNVARPLCEQMKAKFVVYKGEKWSEPYCICRGNFTDKVSVFASVDGEEIELKADNWFNDFRGFNRNESFSRRVNIYIPNCENVCWP